MKWHYLVCLLNWLLIILTLVKYTYSRILDLEFQSEPLTAMVTPHDGRVIFRCSASPSTAVISWLWNGELLTSDSNTRFHVGGHRLIVHLPKKNNQEDINLYDNSEVQCVAHYKKRALLSLPAKLIIGKLEAFSEQDDFHITSVVGNIAVIPCDPPPSIPIAVTEFYFKDIIISRSTDRYHLMPSGNLQIFGIQFNDSGSYRCDVLNPFLNEKKMAKHQVILSVIDANKRQEPTFLVSLSNTTNIVMGSNVTLECAANGFPPPNITWEKQYGHLPKGRHLQFGGNLLLLNVMQDDEGTYICHADNGIGKKISTSTIMLFHEIPQLLNSPEDQQLTKGENVTVECIIKGYPKPKITWYHNGKIIIENNRIDIKEGILTIKKTLLRDSGIYQCFAINELGSTYGVFVIEVQNSSNLSKDWNIDDDDETLHLNQNIYPDIANEKKGQKKKKYKGVKMVPPGKPKITRLSESSVMVRWQVPDNDGLPILFFRVQYKEVGKRSSQWKTIDEDIASHLLAHAVSGLKTGGKYRFRIAAVYANHDNKLGSSSEKFILYKEPPIERPESEPTIILAEAVSPSAIRMDWKYSEVDTVPIEGFFISYRATHSAGDYMQVIVLGSNTRSHILSHLLPDTSYDIKMQSFNLHGTSDFSNIYTAKTLPSNPLSSYGQNNNPQQDWSSSNSGTVSVSSKSIESSKLVYIILGSVLGIMLLVLFIFIILCVRRQQRQRQHLQNTEVSVELHLKPSTNGHIATSNGFLKGTEKVNISVNPLNEYLKEDVRKLNHTSDIPCNNNETITLNNIERIRQPSEMESFSEHRNETEYEPTQNETEYDPMLPNKSNESSKNINITSPG